MVVEDPAPAMAKQGLSGGALDDGDTEPAASAIDFHALSGVDLPRERFTVSRPIELRSCMRSVPELIVTLRTRNGDPKSGSAAVLAFLRRADMTD